MPTIKFDLTEPEDEGPRRYTADELYTIGFGYLHGVGVAAFENVEPYKGLLIIKRRLRIEHGVKHGSLADFRDTTQEAMKLFPDAFRANGQI